MNAHLSIGALVAAACTSMSYAGPVVELAPGDFTAGLSGITNSVMSELIGTIEFDYLQNFSVGGVEGGSVDPLYEATLMTRVVRSNQTGNLTFNFRIMEANAALTGQVSHIEITGFNGLETRVEYRNEPGFGDQGPSIAARSFDGDILTFDFNESFETAESSKFFFAMLDVSEYDFEGNAPQATIYLLSGDSISLDIAPPVPAPGSMALLGAAGLCFTRRRR
jgi:hypothetical protein